MNRYFWLLMRFVGDEQTPEQRREIYDRARTAFMEQILGSEPPIPEAEVAYERLAFEEAVRTAEAGIARWGEHRAPQPGEVV